MSFSPVSHIGVSAAGDASQNAEAAPISRGCNATSQDVNFLSFYCMFIVSLEFQCNDLTPFGLLEQGQLLSLDRLLWIAASRLWIAWKHFGGSDTKAARTLFRSLESPRPGLVELIYISKFVLFFQVLIKNWINGNEKSFLEGQSARFGASLPISLSKAIKLPAALANPFDSCTKLSSKVSNSIVIAKRGNCNYEDKAKIAESCGAAALLVINDDEDTPVMVCTQNDTPPNISIPVVMIPKSAGDSISVNLSTGSKGEYQTSFLMYHYFHL
ncbi:hypothetical protein ZIOFF_005988 [Zingiber officinale]|uniref:PA domain-containing protein n=1 Tax=Zingiber officinale TaxID=94328 RepID=A0A8J5LN00_ZINOF|nr:hypothetical protein ZIOFF_005988 [Zingiber officinale]